MQILHLLVFSQAFDENSAPRRLQQSFHKHRWKPKQPGCAAIEQDFYSTGDDKRQILSTELETDQPDWFTRRNQPYTCQQVPNIILFLTQSLFFKLSPVTRDQPLPFLRKLLLELDNILLILNVSTELGKFSPN
jgi:hypothetical protein